MFSGCWQWCLGTATPNHSDCQVYLSISVGEFGGGVGLFWVSLCSLWWQVSTPIQGCEFVLSPSMVVKSSFPERCTRIALMASTFFVFPSQHCGPPGLHIKKRLWRILSDDQLQRRGPTLPLLEQWIVPSAEVGSWKEIANLFHRNLGVLFDKPVCLAWHDHSGESRLYTAFAGNVAAAFAIFFCICFLYKGLIILLNSYMYSLTSINVHYYAFKVNNNYKGYAQDRLSLFFSV